jgi:hypothetical protein
MSVKFKTQGVNKENLTVTTTLANGLKIVACLGDIPEALHPMLMLHGLKQKVGDAASQFSATSDFSGAFNAMQRVVDNLMNGLWSAKGGSGAGSDLTQAVANLKKIDLTDAQDIIDDLDEEQLTKLLARPAVKAEILRLKAERAMKVAEALDEDIGI